MNIGAAPIPLPGAFQENPLGMLIALLVFLTIGIISTRRLHEKKKRSRR